MLKFRLILIPVFIFLFTFFMPVQNLFSYSDQAQEELTVSTIDDKKSDDDFLTVEATAYTQSVEEGTADGITASGTVVHRGVVAVDPDYIPLGTRLYIENYGYAYAEDTGGAIKGNRIDLFMDSKTEAMQFGRQSVKVWVVE